MRTLQRRFSGLVLAMLLVILQTGCGMSSAEYSSGPAEQLPASSTSVSLEVQVTPIAPAVPETTEASELPDWLPEEGEYYYDVENVVLYLYLYDDLPDNYITKSEARELGWEGGSVEKYQEGAAIGGDTFGNREGLLPEKEGRDYTECDIDTDGGKSRGAKRLVFSDDGIYYYTEDHYESFDEVIVTEEFEVIW